MKKILVTIFTVLGMIFLQLLYINYRLEQRLNKISAEQKLTGVELQKVEEELFTSAVKLADFKMQMKKQNSEKPELLLASND